MAKQGKRGTVHITAVKKSSMKLCQCVLFRAVAGSLKAFEKAKTGRKRLLVICHKRGRHKVGKDEKERDLEKMLHE